MLNHVLTTDQELNAAVLVTDMGGINIAADLIRCSSAESTDEDSLVDRLEDYLLTDSKITTTCEHYPDPFGADDRQEHTVANN